jgi:hypothetical protein
MKCVCGNDADCYGDHFLTCRSLSNQFNRHKLVLEIIRSAVQMLGLASKTEIPVVGCRADLVIYELENLAELILT